MSSGVTSKPAIEGHFKTGQRTITLDELLFYPTGWPFGKSNLIQSGRYRQVPGAKSARHFARSDFSLFPLWGRG